MQFGITEWLRGYKLEASNLGLNPGFTFIGCL